MAVHSASLMLSCYPLRRLPVSALVGSSRARQSVVVRFVTRPVLLVRRDYLVGVSLANLIQGWQAGVRTRVCVLLGTSRTLPQPIVPYVTLPVSFAPLQDFQAVLLATPTPSSQEPSPLPVYAPLGTSQAPLPTTVFPAVRHALVAQQAWPPTAKLVSPMLF